MPSAELGHTKREIALRLKRSDALTLAQLAAHLRVSREAVRVQVNEMIRGGWVARNGLPRRDGKAGRPATTYCLTDDGQHLFPKHYDDLASQLLDILAASAEPGQRERVLAELTERRMAPWRGKLHPLSLEQRLELLKDVYRAGDPFVEIERCDGGWRLIERNCPFLNVALQHPALCSTTVNLLTRLLAVRVVREQRFQDGANRCVFRIYPDRPSGLRSFELEPEPEG